MSKQKDNKIRMKYGTRSLIKTFVFFAILIAVNIIAGRFDLTVDITDDQKYTLSDQTETLIKDLDKDITIYAIYNEGSEDTGTIKILKNYEELNSHIKYKVVDPDDNPLFAQQYGDDATKVIHGSIIVQYGDKYKILTSNDMTTYGIDETTYMPTVESFNVESHVTGAILHVIGNELYVAYILSGHGEIELSKELQSNLKGENYDLRELNLVSEQRVPEDADLLIINSPGVDISDDEVNYLREYLENDGRAMISISIATASLPKFTSLLEPFYVEMGKSMVIEGDTKYVYQNNPYYLIPSLATNTITSPILESNMSVFFPYAQGIIENPDHDDYISIEPLLTTSESSYGKYKIDNVKNYEKEEGDADGPFNLACAVTKRNTEFGGNYTKLILTGGTSLQESEINNIVNGGNFDFYINSLNWLIDREDAISVRGKNTATSEKLVINTQKSIVMAGVSVILLPALIFIIGIFEVIKRRKK
ncbi:MAG: GldG family protein [Lachnospiraceae bacterium]|nr:GldG family protein [Lachnospiraceae bacterium]